jgi:lipoprotein-releasing system permease protein
MFSLKVALRFLKKSKGQTILIVLGIGIGISIQIFLGSLIGGLQADLVDSTIGNSSQITIKSSQEDSYIADYQDILDDLDANEELQSVSTSIDASGTLIDGEKTEPIYLRGFDFDSADSIYDIQENLIEGNVPTEVNQVMLGTDLFESLGLELNDIFEVSIPLKGSTDVEVVGVYDFNVSSINNLWVLTKTSSVQILLGLQDVVSEIEIQVNEVFDAQTIATSISSELGDQYTITNWMDENEDLLSALTAQSSSSLMIQVFVTISVVLGIASVLAISVIQKSKQIGILKAMGIKDSKASLIFLFEGLLLGLMGAICGVLLGLGLSASFSAFALNAAGEPVVNLLFDPAQIAISALVGILASSLASLIPAWKSSRLSVIEVIKNG